MLRFLSSGDFLNDIFENSHSGGIAVGKTTVTKQLREEGLPIVDLDLIAADVVRKDRWGHQRLVAAFGNEVGYMPFV